MKTQEGADRGPETSGPQFRYPMKPISVNRRAVLRMDLSKYWMERKFDGHRAIVVVGGGRAVSLWTRQKTRIREPENLKRQLADLRMEEGTVLDGEIWNPLRRGGWGTGDGEPCVLTLWDCMRLGGADISARGIEERREHLIRAVRGGTEEVRAAEAAEATTEGIEEVEEDVRKFRQENDVRSGYVHGIVLKRKGSPRRDHATRSQEHPDWLKLVF